MSDPLSGRELAAFVATVETGSLHAAADELGLTQSAVTKRIQAIERRAGVTLLERGRLGARATDTGRRLYPEAKEALAALGRAETVMTRASADHAHTLRIAASHTVGEFLLPRWLYDFRADIADPLLHSEVDIANSPGVLAQVRAGEVELGFVEGLDELRGLESLTLMHDELVVVVAADHRWSRRRTVGVRDLAGEDYLTRERDSGTRAVATAALARVRGRARPGAADPEHPGPQARRARRRLHGPLARGGGGRGDRGDVVHAARARRRPRARAARGARRTARPGLRRRAPVELAGRARLTHASPPGFSTLTIAVTSSPP